MVKPVHQWIEVATALALVAGAVSFPHGSTEAAEAKPDAKAEALPRSSLLLKSSITGGNLEASMVMQTPLPAAPGAFVQLMAPSAVAARGRDVFIVDAGYALVFRYDIVLNTLTVLPNLTGRPGMRLHVMADSSLLVLDPGTRRVLHLTRDGLPINTYQDDINLVRPVAMAVDQRNGLVLVADSMENFIVAFHMLGRASSLIVPKADGDRSLSLSGIAMAPDGLYVLDKLARQVLRLTADGRVIEAFGEDVLRQPAVIASDRAGRLLVSEAHGGSLKIFLQGVMVDEVRKPGLASEPWQDIADVYVGDTGDVFVADVSGRVDVLRAPGSRRR